MKHPYLTRLILVAALSVAPGNAQDNPKPNPAPPPTTSPAPPAKKPAEKEGTPGQALTPLELIAKRDVDKDGRISREEWLAPFKVKEKHKEFSLRFDKQDTNGDGYLTLEEMMAYRKGSVGDGPVKKGRPVAP